MDNEQQIVARPRQLAIVDLATGEIVEPNLMIIGRKPKKVDTGFIKIFVTFLADVVEDQEIAGKSIRLLLYMLQKLEWNSLIVKVFPKEAMKELNIGKMTYHRWINTLIEKKLIIKLDTHSYMFNVYTGVKGYQQKAIEEDQKKLEKRKENLA